MPDVGEKTGQDWLTSIPALPHARSAAPSFAADYNAHRDFKRRHHCVYVDCCESGNFQLRILEMLIGGGSGECRSFYVCVEQQMAYSLHVLECR